MKVMIHHSISMLTHPIVVGRDLDLLCGDAEDDIQLKLLKSRPLAGKTWVLFRVLASRRKI